MGVWCASANVGAPPRHCSVSDKNIITLDRYNFVISLEDIIMPPMYSYRNTEINLHHVLYKLLYVSSVSSYVRIRSLFGSIIYFAHCQSNSCTHGVVSILGNLRFSDRQLDQVCHALAQLAAAQMRIV